MKYRDVRFLLAALLAAFLAGGLWYARPVGLDTLYPGLKPDLIDVGLLCFSGSGHDGHSFRLTSDDPEFDPLLTRLEALRFRRLPTNLLLQAMPFLEDLLPAATKTIADGEIQHLIIGLAQDNGTDHWRSGHLQLWVDQWAYRDFDHNVSLPLAMADGNAAGQALARELWAIAESFDSNL